MASSTAAQDKVIGNQGILVIGFIVGLFVIQPLARSSPVLVNGILALILFSSLLFASDRWLPYLAQFSKATGGSGAKASGVGAGGKNIPV